MKTGMQVVIKASGKTGRIVFVERGWDCNGAYTDVCVQIDQFRKWYESHELQIVK